jgi:hypothetical protein
MSATHLPARRRALRWFGAVGASSTLPLGMPALAQGKCPEQPIKLIVARRAGGSVAACMHWA